MRLYSPTPLYVRSVLRNISLFDHELSKAQRKVSACLRFHFKIFCKHEESLKKRMPQFTVGIQEHKSQNNVDMTSIRHIDIVLTFVFSNSYSKLQHFPNLCQIFGHQMTLLCLLCSLWKRKINYRNELASFESDTCREPIKKLRNRWETEEYN